MKAALRQNWRHLARLSAALCTEERLVLMAVKRSWQALELAGAEHCGKSAFMLEAVRLNWRALRVAAPQLWANRDFLLAAVRRNGMSLRCLPRGQRDYALCLEALSSPSPPPLHYVPRRLRAERELLLQAVRHDWRALERALGPLGASDALDRDFALGAVSCNGLVLQRLPDGLRGDSEVVLAAVRQNRDAARFASAKLRYDRRVLAEVSKPACPDRAPLLQAIGRDWHAFALASEALQEDAGFVLEAAKLNRLVLKAVRAELLRDMRLARRLVRQDWRALELLPEALRADRRLVLEATLQDDRAADLAGGALCGKSAELQAAARRHRRRMGQLPRTEREKALEAVEQDWLALQNLPKALRCDRKVVLAAVHRDWRAFALAHEALRRRRDFVLEVVRLDWRALEFAHEALRGDQDIVAAAVEQDRRALDLLPEESRWDPRLALLGSASKGRAGTDAAGLAQARPGPIRVAVACEDPKAMLSSVRVNWQVLTMASPAVRADADVVFAAVRQDGR